MVYSPDISIPEDPKHWSMYKGRSVQSIGFLSARKFTQIWNSKKWFIKLLWHFGVFWGNHLLTITNFYNLWSAIMISGDCVKLSLTVTGKTHLVRTKCNGSAKYYLTDGNSQLCNDTVTWRSRPHRYCRQKVMKVHMKQKHGILSIDVCEVECTPSCQKFLTKVSKHKVTVMLKALQIWNMKQYGQPMLKLTVWKHSLRLRYFEKQNFLITYFISS